MKSENVVVFSIWVWISNLPIYASQMIDKAATKPQTAWR